MSEQRLIDLETKVSFQEALIDELKQTTHEQYLAIEKLEKNLKHLTDRFNADSDMIHSAHEKPPHY